jgi:hypothetical protein
MRSNRCIDEVKQVLDVALFVLVDDRGCLSLDGDATFTLDSEFVQNLKKSHSSYQLRDCWYDRTPSRLSKTSTLGFWETSPPALIARLPLV